MNDITLEGCTATPLAGYLKALGVLRLLSAKYPETRGAWRSDCFVLATPLDAAGVEHFFLHDYSPSPIISPWSGRAGFLEGEDGEDSTRKGAIVLGRVEAAAGKRFEQYRRVVSAVRNVPVIRQLDQERAERKRLEALKKARKLDGPGAEQLSRVKQREAELKGALLQSLRNELDDATLPWIDACFALSGDVRSPGPLLGSGGNEGSMDFSINHVGHLLELIDEASDRPTGLAGRLIRNSLFASSCARESSSSIGFLDTLATGGANMTAGFEGGSTGNVWDSVLAIEGAVLFASLTTKRLESSASGRPSFPFAVAPSFAGSGGVAAKEAARPELWLPVWTKASTIGEVSTLLAEGRITKGRREARNGVDALQAVSSLGTDRGISAFNRFGFYERRGRGSYVATHLGRFDVPQVATDNWVVRELNEHGWLDSFRLFAAGEHSPMRFAALRKRLEDRLFGLWGKVSSKAEVQELLSLLGEIQSALAASAKARDVVRPVPRLSERWVIAADDDTQAFRIAKALAGLRGVGDEWLPLRAQLFPVHRRFDEWMTPRAGERYRISNDTQGRLIDTLRGLLQRRLLLAERLAMEDKPLDSPAGARVDDVAAFLRESSMDERLADLLPGLALCEIPEDVDRSAGDGVAPAAFALMKLAMTPERTLRSLDALADGQRLPVPAGMLAQLSAGNHDNRAVASAWRRLRASGVTPLFAPGALPTLAGIDPRRVAAALLIPLRFGSTAALVRAVLKQPEVESA
jgi:CRISPR-associated protein Csx17